MSRFTHALRMLTGPSLVLALALGLTVGLPRQSGVVEPDIELAAAQSARVLMYPQLTQPGSTPASADAALSAIVAQFSPIRKGRKVVLQQKRGASWVTLKTGYQNPKGRVEFSAPYKYAGKPAVYRAFTVRLGSLGKVTSAGVATNKWGASDFLDQFAGTGFTSNWASRPSSYAPDAKRTCTRVETDNGTSPIVAGGVAQIKVSRDSTPPKTALGTVKNCVFTTKTGEVENHGSDWRNGNSIGTQGKFSFRYGVAAARMKFNQLAGVHASFWLSTATSQREEIDIIEWMGDRANNDTEMQNGMFDFATTPPADYGLDIKSASRFGSGWYSKFHVFSVEWSPRLLIFRIDGKETRRIAGSMVSDQAMTPILSMHSSDYEYKLISASRLPQKTMVDWVRVWDLDPLH